MYVHVHVHVGQYYRQEDGKYSSTYRRFYSTFVPSLWKTTTLPPLSPVARNSPSWLNSTVEIMSAGKDTHYTIIYKYFTTFTRLKQAIQPIIAQNVALVASALKHVSCSTSLALSHLSLQWTFRTNEHVDVSPNYTVNNWLLLICTNFAYKSAVLCDNYGNTYPA